MTMLRKWLICSIGYAMTQVSFGTIVINEIHYNPDVKTEQVEFVELYNAGEIAVDLSGWQLADGVDYTIPAGTTLDAGFFLVVAQNPTALLEKFSEPSLGPWTGKLNNDGERISLLNAGGEVMDEVDYQLGFPWPTVGDAPDYSIELINPAFDNDLGGNWRRSYDESSGIIPYQEAISAESSWRYRKATSEASTPSTLWRDFAFDDSGWSEGQAPIGYQIQSGSFWPGFVKTTLHDMQYSYTGLFLRKIFIVDDPAEVDLLVLDVAYDDGFKAWINGVNVTNANISAGEVPYNGIANSSLDDNIAYYHFLLNNPELYLLPGTNVIAIQAHNYVSYAGWRDFWFDAKLTIDVSTRNGPTPGQQNWAFENNAPPAIRQVDHEPRQPSSDQTVTITAKVTDLEGVASVVLDYQIVTPGSYIELNDPSYATSWAVQPMYDDGNNGDAMAGDSIFTAIIPASVQQHRTLVRYRISVSDGAGGSVTVPYSGDPQPNFAYFCYDGVPEWQAAVQPGTTPVLNFSTNIMRRLPAIHLISKNAAVEDATWFERYSGDLYKWTGTLVYDGNVYDHVRYRARGGFWRYAMCKNMWKFDFNRGHDFQMRDDYGHKYDTKWTKLNLGACIQQGNSGFRGEQGMFEAVGSQLFNLAGVNSFNTDFLQLRIVDEAAEATTNQYEGDFWGLYLATEQLDGRFLDEHGLPDGNLYKMLKTGSGELNNTGPLGPTDKSDLNYILDNYTDASNAWWRENWKLEDYYSYQTIVQGIHHYDINAGKNYFYYHHPETGLWEVAPWDLDLTWADNMFQPSWGGLNPLASRILEATASGNLLQLPGDARPEFRMEFRNRVREIRDLLFNTEQAGQLIDEYANLLRDPAVSPSFLDADRAMWDYNPKMDSPIYSSHPEPKAGTGKFYQWPLLPGTSQDFSGCVQLMKNYVVSRSVHLDDLATDAAIPDTPAITYTGAAGYPFNELSFQSSAFSDPDGNETFAAMQWRAGEVLDVSAPAYDPTEPPPYEIAAIWESGELASYNSDITIPTDALKVGHAYRVRVRMKDNTGRWSHWSAPVEFITGESSASADLINYLRVSELMYDPTNADFEFIELHNTSTSQSLDLAKAAFTAGVDYNFPDGSEIEPEGYLLVIGNTNTTAFRAHYGLSGGIAIKGPYLGKLSNGGEELKLNTAPGGSEIASFTYNSDRTWPLAAAGAGHSLVPVSPSADGQATGALDYPGNWRASTYIDGSPGSIDPMIPAASVVLNEITACTDYTNPAHPEYDSNDWIELFNTTGASISLAGWYLSDDPADPTKWPIPSVHIPAGERLVLTEVDDFHSPITSGFGIDKTGEQVLLSYLPGTAGDRVVDAVGFKGQENNVSLSRYPDGTGFWYAANPSYSTPNNAPLEGLRFTEIMYQPSLLNGDDNVHDEYIEIHNPTDLDIPLQNAGESWQLDGGVTYTFPDNTVLPARGTLLVVSFDPNDTTASNAFVAAYGITTSLRFFGPYSGNLGNRSDRISLEKPQAPGSPGEAYSWVIEDETLYGNQNPWSENAAGGGYALARISMSQHGNDPANWRGEAPSPGRDETVDTDGDSMPDGWEIIHALNPNSAADATEDADSDGQTNIDEYHAGTDPNDSESVFKIEWIGLSNAEIHLQFTAGSGKSYAVLYRPDLNIGTSWNIMTNIYAGTRTLQLLIEDPSWTMDASRYYRLVTPAELMEDSDGDGLSDLDESIAGTDPKDPDSVFEIEQFSQAPCPAPSFPAH